MSYFSLLVAPSHNSVTAILEFSRCLQWFITYLSYIHNSALLGSISNFSGVPLSMSRNWIRSVSTQSSLFVRVLKPPDPPTKVILHLPDIPSDMTAADHRGYGAGRYVYRPTNEGDETHPLQHCYHGIRRVSSPRSRTLLPLILQANTFGTLSEVIGLICASLTSMLLPKCNRAGQAVRTIATTRYYGKTEDTARNLHARIPYSLTLLMLPFHGQSHKTCETSFPSLVQCFAEIPHQPHYRKRHSDPIVGVWNLGKPIGGLLLIWMDRRNGFSFSKLNIKSGRRVSFGRGGAGNIRHYADARLVEEEPSVGVRRRSSVWSTSSSDSSHKGLSLVHSVRDVFRRKSLDDTPEESLADGTRRKRLDYGLFDKESDVITKVMGLRQGIWSQPH
ncbi:uncharacterized protein CLUP02_15901 [Colletotrichum lupini]|uniref:Uncharacterized protein n=1 Tax=Colletotrichum lupini TaxID=145971 RepID=A0A9Q8T9B5_9PEZI|nr:uncharacterized protein CLUP02_15901 [Colletotrichum lupini]UQC90371.1 hypothetical protein CLUP02_15901 [Colletotrichum lupini]